MKKLFVFVALLVLLAGFVAPHNAAANNDCGRPEPDRYWYFDWGEMPGEINRYVMVTLTNGDEVRIVGRVPDGRSNSEFYVQPTANHCLESGYFALETVDYLNGAGGEDLEAFPDYIDFLEEVRRGPF